MNLYHDGFSLTDPMQTVQVDGYLTCSLEISGLILVGVQDIK